MVSDSHLGQSILLHLKGRSSIMRFYALFIICVFLVQYLDAVEAHQPGEEFSYLSMFLERDDQSPEVNLDDLYRTYSSSSTSLRKKTRRLQQREGEADSTFVTNAATAKASKSKSDLAAIVDEDVEELDPDVTERAVRAAAATNPTPESNPPLDLLSAKSTKTLELGNETPDKLAERHGEDIKRLSEMVTKLIRQYRVTSLVDVPCRAHAHWMPNVLRELSKRGGGGAPSNFRYICVDTNQQVLGYLKRRLVEANVHRGARFELRKFWNEPLPKADLVLSWAGLDNMSEDNVLGFFKNLAASSGRHKIIIIGSHSGALVKTGDAEKISQFTSRGNPINVRKEPFLLAQPGRIIKELCKKGNDKQMYVYVPEKLFEFQGDRND